MSLGELEFHHDLNQKKINKNIETPVFYFVYNTDNYYHFVYDTLPYLITFNYLRSKVPCLKLLMNYPNPSMKKFYRFVEEFLILLDINFENDVLIIDTDVTYENVYISSSYTHDDMSENPPRKEIFDLYDLISKKACSLYVGDSSNTFEKFYVSRRTWKEMSDVENIGTNYTLRRRLINEDEVVDLLVSMGYSEIFSENLSTIEKLYLFKNAKSIVGTIGGGMCNVLFSNPDVEVTVLVSPGFFDVNRRFKYSLDCRKSRYYYDTYHFEKSFWKKYMRVRVKDSDIIGEIEEIDGENIKVLYSTNLVSGWNSSVKYEVGYFPMEKCKSLDNGLNSTWFLDIEKIKEFL